MPFAIRRLGPGDESVLALLAEEASDFDLPGRTSPERPLSSTDAAAYLADPASCTGSLRTRDALPASSSVGPISKGAGVLVVADDQGFRVESLD
jgi:hypothetical protein